MDLYHVFVKENLSIIHNYNVKGLLIYPHFFNTCAICPGFCFLQAEPVKWLSGSGVPKWFYIVPAD